MVPIPLLALLPAHLALILVVSTVLEPDSSNVPNVPPITISLPTIVLLVLQEPTLPLVRPPPVLALLAELVAKLVLLVPVHALPPRLDTG